MTQPTDSQYNYITRFIGYQQMPFVAIIDAEAQLKYVLSIGFDFQPEQFLDFMDQFYLREIEPYYASETVPEQDEKDTCLRLVGDSYVDFLARDEPLKIVYLYSSDPVCSDCKRILKQFEELASRHHEAGQLLFGYFDVSNNDNRLIKDEIFPYFLIYVLDNFEDPYGISAEEFKELDTYIGQMKKEFKEEAQSTVHDALE